jgi:hypothetical protein
MNKMNQKNKINNNQQGFVAFFVTIMVMIIFGILILSFSQISNREGVSALNRNLSTNALYAAESGINDAYTAIRTAYNNSQGSTSGGPVTFNETGSPQSYVVPSGVTSINVTLYGGSGGGIYNYPNTGGLGGETTGALSVTPGETLTVIVGAAGTNGTYTSMCTSAGGYGGGGTALSGSAGCGGGGGGASRISNGSTALAIAGGGGGGGGNGGTGGGNGGGLIGGNGTPDYWNPSTPGTGGTQSAGGTGANNGTLGIGGNGSIGGSIGYGSGGGGGGGGGYYGGGGGGGFNSSDGNSGGSGGPAGGGSSLVPAGGTTTAGVQSGNGQIIISPIGGPSPSQTQGQLQQTSSCTPSTYGNPVINSNTQYTCILVSSSPSNLSYLCPSFCPNNSIVSYIKSSGNPINDLRINWSDSNKSNSGCSTQTPLPFLPSSGWPSNCLELLRVDLVPFTSGTTTLSSLESSVKTFFLYPQSSASATQSFASITNGAVYSANCSSSSRCIFDVSSLSASGPSYYARVQYYYGTSPTISFTGTDLSGNNIEFTGSQIQIDATGLSGTVLKRVSANIALNGSNSSPYSLPLPPNYALQSTDSICKSFLQYQSNLYQIIPSNKPGDIIDSASSANEILTNNNSDFCNPI